MRSGKSGQARLSEVRRGQVRKLRDVRSGKVKLSQESQVRPS